MIDRATGRWWRRVGALLVLAAVAAVGFWAGRVVLLPPDDPLDAGTVPITYTVAMGEVGRSFRFAAVAEWGLTPLARNAAPGVLTSVDFVSGDVVETGQVLYSVNLRPVVVAEGAVPAFRALLLNSSGPDVAQLQAFLGEMGMFDGEVDGVFRSSTRAAVLAWQRSFGLTADGVVLPGDVIFVPELPARLALAETATVGSPLGGGEGLVLLVPDTPEFRVPLSFEQRSLVPLDATVRVSYAEGTWEGRVERAVEDPSFGLVNLVLATHDGGPLCGDECARWVSLHNATNFSVEIVVLPHTEGPAVPVAAIRSDAGNQPYVVGEDGSRIDIVIVASAQGIAIVEGVAPGTVILLTEQPPGS